MSLMCNVFASLETDHSVINYSKFFFEILSHGCSRNVFKPCGTSVQIYSSLNKEQQKTVSKTFYSLPKALKMR